MKPDYEKRTLAVMAIGAIVLCLIGWFVFTDEYKQLVEMLK